MPRPRSPNRDKAYEIYTNYNGKIENRRIAEQLDEDERLIAKWKHEDEWVKKNKGVHHSTKGVHQTLEGTASTNGKKYLPNNAEGTRQEPSGKIEESKTDTKRHGAPKGNQNAAKNRGGNGAPIGNKRAVTTGEHEIITYAGLTDEEKAIAAVPFDKFAEQEDLIGLERVRRHRMMQRIEVAENAPGGMVIVNIVETKSENIYERVDGVDENGEVRKKKRSEVMHNSQTAAESSVKRVLEIEAGLTRVVANAQRGIAQYHKMELDDSKREAANTFEQILEHMQTLSDRVLDPVPNRELPKDD